jgi:hypothetical protein
MNGKEARFHSRASALQFSFAASSLGAGPASPFGLCRGIFSSKLCFELKMVEAAGIDNAAAMLTVVSKLR